MLGEVFAGDTKVVSVSLTVKISGSNSYYKKTSWVECDETGSKINYVSIGKLKPGVNIENLNGESLSLEQFDEKFIWIHNIKIRNQSYSMKYNKNNKYLVFEIGEDSKGSTFYIQLE